MPKDGWARSSRAYQLTMARARQAKAESKAQHKKARRRGWGDNGRSKPPPMKYIIPAGTSCEVRRQGSAEWRPHKTTKQIEPVGFLWRNETHYGFAWAGYEVKVKVGAFRV